MSHLIDTSTGKAAIAYTGETPWHGLGQALTAGADLETWAREGGLNWTALRSFVRYATGPNMAAGDLIVDQSNVVIFRSDTKAPLGIVSADYKVVQPAEVLELFRDLTEKHGYAMETVGAIKSGRQVWALARGGESADIGGGDTVNDYLLCSTSFDGSRATVTRQTSIRVVCNNTLTLAESVKGGHRVSHRSRWAAGDAKRALKVGAFARFAEQAQALAQVRVEPAQVVPFLLQAYHGLTTQQVNDAERAAVGGDAKAARLVKSVNDTLVRLSDILVNAPGQQLATAENTLWGVVNAVTYDVDHVGKSRTDENRLNSAWFGPGDALKTQVWNAALQAANDRTALAVDGGELLGTLLGKAA